MSTATALRVSRRTIARCKLSVFRHCVQFRYGRSFPYSPEALSSPPRCSSTPSRRCPLAPRARPPSPPPCCARAWLIYLSLPVGRSKRAPGSLRRSIPIATRPACLRASRARGWCGTSSIFRLASAMRDRVWTPCPCWIPQIRAFGRSMLTRVAFCRGAGRRARNPPSRRWSRGSSTRAAMDELTEVLLNSGTEATMEVRYCPRTQPRARSGRR